MPVDWSKITFKDLINIKKYLIGELYDGVKISTICASCKVGDNLNLKNMYDYVSLNSDDVIVIKKNNSDMKTLIEIKQPKRRSKSEQLKKKTSSFQNSLTVVMRSETGDYETLDRERKVNLKIFNNGSIQMSGCKDINAVNNVLNKITYMIKKGKTIRKDGVKVKINYCDFPEKIRISDFKLDTINCNYRVRITINREKLFRLMVKKGVKCNYENCIRRACVNIKYQPKDDNPDEKLISLSVFEKGSILIAGAKNKSQLVQSIKFINEIFVTHLEDIQKSALDDVIRKSKYKNLLLEDEM